MTIDEINSKIKSLNAIVHKKNEERQILIGKMQALESQYKKLVEQYKVETGVDLTQVSIDDEVARVIAEKTSQVEKLEKMIALIDAGQYTEAESLINESVGVDSTVSTQTTTVVEEATSEVKEAEAVSVPTVSDVVAPTTVVNNTSSEVDKPISEVKETVSEPVKVAPPVSDVVAPPLSKPSSPLGVSAPKKPVSSFSDILGGSAFVPNNGN